MSEKHPSIESVEKYITHLQESSEIGAGNLPLFEELPDDEYREIVDSLDYWRFVQSADHHYFISRILFLRQIYDYSMFCGYQCIENYLKGYLRYKNQHTPKSHNLDKLVNLCRKIAPRKDKFIYDLAT